ncbi:MAG: phage tail fiber protein [Cycloclasticus sp.]|tara:strand:+ start:2479 stop:2907 length:429 start_codon:yes stop_codon:yes gene_type:complete
MATSNAATTYLENKILSFIFKNNAGSFATPGDSIYVGLATAVSDAEAGSLTEATFGSYARQQVTAANWTLASASTDQQTVTNAANIEFPASTGTSNTVTHAFLVDAASSGNILFVGALDANKTIATGDIFRINAGNLTVELK